MAPTVLQLIDLHLTYPGGRGRADVTAIQGVSLQLAQGEMLGLVGESGSGKSSLARCVAGLEAGLRGRITYADHGEQPAYGRTAELRRWRRGMEMIFQNPAGSLNPVYRVGQVLREAALRADPHDKAVHETVIATLARVGLDAGYLDRLPRQLSGGQQQRVAIARALVSRPRLLICDEIVSALDVSVQARLLNLLRDLREGGAFSGLFISHDLAVTAYLCDRIAVMKEGRIVEIAPTEQLLEQPAHEYTRKLLAAAQPSF
ncbi:MAG: ATP-binding cassette domain-containing protein [Saprospiraceae bacterium]